MNSKIPPDAFTFYMSLGPARSYQAVATRYGVNKRSVTKRAVEEKWQEKAKDLEQQAQKRGEARIVDTLDEMNERHLKMLKVIQGKALESLRNEAMRDPAKAAQALVAALRMERLLRGEPEERSELSVVEIVKRETESWLTAERAAEDGEAPDARDDEPPRQASA